MKISQLLSNQYSNEFSFVLEKSGLLHISSHDDTKTKIFSSQEEASRFYTTKKDIIEKNKNVLFFTFEKEPEKTEIYLKKKDTLIFFGNYSLKMFNSDYFRIIVYDDYLTNKIIDETFTFSESEKTIKKITEELFLVNELSLNEIKNSYGGWISHEKKIFLVPQYYHEDFIKSYEGLKKYIFAFKLGYVRFVSEMFPREFSVEGFNESLISTFRIWKDVGLSSRLLIIDIPYSPEKENSGISFAVKTIDLDEKTLLKILRDPLNYKKYYKYILEEKKSSLSKQKKKPDLYENIF